MAGFLGRDHLPSSVWDKEKKRAIVLCDSRGPVWWLGPSLWPSWSSTVQSPWRLSTPHSGALRDGCKPSFESSCSLSLWSLTGGKKGQNPEHKAASI